MGLFGDDLFAEIGSGSSTSTLGKPIACLGDSSTHGGKIIYPGQLTVWAGNAPVAVSGALHSCPIPYHGTTAITPITLKTYAGGKLIVTLGAIAGCGAIIIPKYRDIGVE